jgi:hypothetical protein
MLAIAGFETPLVHVNFIYLVRNWQGQVAFFLIDIDHKSDTVMKTMGEGNVNNLKMPLSENVLCNLQTYDNKMHYSICLLVL